MHPRIKTFVYAWRGICVTLRTQPNAQIHTAIGTLVVLAGWFFGLSPTEWSLLVLCIALVLAAEAFNTAVESVVDLVSPDFHPLAGRAKDAAAGAVLLLACGAAVVGSIVFIPKIFRWL